MTPDHFYVSITGLRLKGRRHLPRFWWHTIRSITQARKASGNLKVEARMINGTYHTLSVWTDEQAMRAFLVSGAHREAMKVFRTMATGRTLGFTIGYMPDWETGFRRWLTEATEV